MQLSWIQQHQPKGVEICWLLSRDQGSNPPQVGDTTPAPVQLWVVSPCVTRPMLSTITSVQSYIIPESCLLLLDRRKFQEPALVVCQIFISIRDRKSEDHQWDVMLDLKETVADTAVMFQEPMFQEGAGCGSSSRFQPGLLRRTAHFRSVKLIQVAYCFYPPLKVCPCGCPWRGAHDANPRRPPCSKVTAKNTSQISLISLRHSSRA